MRHERAYRLLASCGFLVDLGCAARPRAYARASSPRPLAPLVTLDSEGCYGPCPLFEITVFGDGTVFFDSHQGIHPSSEAARGLPARWTLPDGELVELATLIRKGGFESSPRRDAPVTRRPYRCRAPW
jgi:hypothetical protein